MHVTDRMRAERALMYLEEQLKDELDSIEKLEGIALTPIIILRNKKRILIAEIEQAIRNIRDEINMAEGLGA